MIRVIMLCLCVLTGCVYTAQVARTPDIRVVVDNTSPEDYIVYTQYLGMNIRIGRAGSIRKETMSIPATRAMASGSYRILLASPFGESYLLPTPVDLSSASYLEIRIMPRLQQSYVKDLR